MGSTLKSAYAMSAVQIIAFTPVWKYYVSRIGDGYDEPWGFVSLITYVVILFVSKTKRRPERISLVLPAILTLSYAATYPFVPNLVRAAIAVTAVGCTFSSLRLSSPMHTASWGLLLLSLPVMPSLQFYLGYPLRIVSGLFAAALLKLAGFSVILEGTGLRWGTELISIDVPCSGVRMLWTGLYVAFTSACLLRLGTRRTFAAVVASIAAVVLGNGIRAASLFQVEAGLFKMPAWGHDAVGIVVFAGVAFSIIWSVHWIGGNVKCADTPCA